MVFSDTQNYWAKNAIDSLQNRQIIKGYPDGSFRPDRSVTRAEFAVLMCRAYSAVGVKREPIAFTDIPDNYWAKEDIETASAKGFFAGFPDQTFRPELPISRVQATIVLAALQRDYLVVFDSGEAIPIYPQDYVSPFNPGKLLERYFDDAADIPSYAKKIMAMAVINRMVINYPDIRKFQPNRSATRGEIAALIQQSLNVIHRESPYLATNNIFVIPPIFESATPFSEGLALVKKEGDRGHGFIDSTGEFVIAPNSERTYRTSFSEGLAGFSIDGEGGYIDKTGNVVIPPKFFAFGIGKFREGLAAVQVEYEGKWGYTDKNGNLAIEGKFDKAGDFINGLALVSLGRRWGYIDKSGEFAIEPENPNSINVPETGYPIDLLEYYLSDFSEGRARIKIDQYWGYLDTNGNTVIPLQFKEAKDFSEGLAAVQVDNKWGYIDLNGNWIVEPKLTGAASFSDGFAAVSFDGKLSFIDKTGKVVLEPEFSSFSSFSEGLAPVCIGGIDAGNLEIPSICGFFNKKGDVIIQPQFYSVSNFAEGFALVRLRGDWEKISIGYDSSAIPVEFKWALRGGNYGYIYNPLL